jgi:hypothetical protein
MIDFMIIAAPRSGTAWAANWLTTELSFCLHDPLFERHYSEIDDLRGNDGREFGVACTGLAHFPEYLKSHPAKKVVLHRRQDQVNDACAAHGFPPVPMQFFENLDGIKDALHIPWTYLFQKPEGIHRFLFGDRPFDARRHQLLVGLNVQRDIEQIKPNQAATRRLIEEMKNG